MKNEKMKSILRNVIFISFPFNFLSENNLKIMSTQLPEKI